MMINILIADDSEEKIIAIQEVISREFKGVNCDVSRSYNSTTKAIKNKSYNFLVLDMSMPTFDHEISGTVSPLRALAGKDILNKLHYREVSLPVIIITQFDIFRRLSDAIDLDDLITELKNTYPNNFVGSVFYDPQSTKWETELIKLISGVINCE